ncbi:MAG TPA: glutamate--tRNA ligase [Mesorhizobium sp.]|jgi:glutamyl-tRNA synthetase|nr:glutamate--tRNA ligase [Mesorhizobium sp.]
MTVTVRFAPSPTGRIHIGNARTALFNWLFALQNRGRFIQRFDDTDAARSTQGFADGILYDLHWLGVFPDAVEYQSRRMERYEAAAERLKAARLLYPCYETAEELELRRKIKLSRGLPPVYGREALKLTGAEREAFEAEGRRPHWRFLLPNFSGDPFEPQRAEVAWSDMVRGEQSVDLASVSDPVLVRGDGTFLYTLPSVVDDIEMGITHVIRGDDHVTNAGVQIALFKALGAKPPHFAHHNLLVAASGEELSKRTGSLSVAALREQGFEPMAIASLAVLIGTAESVSAAPTLQALAERFDLGATSKSAAKFDPADLFALNRALLRETPFAEVEGRLTALGVTGPDAEPFWRAVRGNVTTLDEVADWWRIVKAGPAEGEELTGEDRMFARDAFELLPDEPFDRDTWKAWTEQVRQATGRKGKALFLPLRVALTGRSSGPELADLLPLLGREGALARRP